MSLAYSHLPVLLFLLSWLIPTSILIGHFSHTNGCSIFIFTGKLFEYVVYTVSHSSPLILRYPTSIQLIAPQKLLSTHSRKTMNVTKCNAQFFVSGPTVAATIFTHTVTHIVTQSQSYTCTVTPKLQSRTAPVTIAPSTHTPLRFPCDHSHTLLLYQFHTSTQGSLSRWLARADTHTQLPTVFLPTPAGW